MVRQVKLIKPYLNKEMYPVEIPEGVILTLEDKKADQLIKKGIAEGVAPLPKSKPKK